ncbi:MAG: CapA family protein, partial [Candidatus Dojkabacteria bacterium]
RSNARQQELARHLADCGVDVVIGHHPHVLQEIEILPSNSPSGNTLIYYSLSNVMGNMLYSTHKSYGNAEDAVIARIVIERDSAGNINISEGKYIKTYIWKDSSSGKVIHRALPVEAVLKSPDKYPITESVLSLLRDSSARIDKVLSSSHTSGSIEIDEYD